MASTSTSGAYPYGPYGMQMQPAIEMQPGTSTLPGPPISETRFARFAATGNLSFSPTPSPQVGSQGIPGPETPTQSGAGDGMISPTTFDRYTTHGFGFSPNPPNMPMGSPAPWGTDPRAVASPSLGVPGSLFPDSAPSPRPSNRSRPSAPGWEDNSSRTIRAADRGRFPDPGPSGPYAEPQNPIPGYNPSAQYPQVPGYDPSAQYPQVPGYDPSAQYAQVPGYDPSAQYPQVPGYPTNPGTFQPTQLYPPPPQQPSTSGQFPVSGRSRTSRAAESTLPGVGPTSSGTSRFSTRPAPYPAPAPNYPPTSVPTGYPAI
ncbi:hypothetical protein FRC01_004715, partial [Tulasnella sp. 417]